MQRARAKQLLLERNRRETEASMHSAEIGEQMDRLHTLIRLAMGPAADEDQAIEFLWREVVYLATLQTRAVACMSVGVLPPCTLVATIVFILSGPPS
jgi:hypothetical protein